MQVVEQFLTNIKRAETPFYAGLKRLAKRLLILQAPIPKFALPLFAAAAHLNALSYLLHQRFNVVFYRYPVFRSRCEMIGRGLDMESIPGIGGPVKIWIGENVRLSGQITILGGRIFQDRPPKFIVKDRVFIGHRTHFSVAQEIVIEDDVLIAGDCMIADFSGHPIDPAKRISGLQPDPDEVRPVRICKNAWIGRRAIILPGVTVGEGAIVGAGTVVTKDVPPFNICVGNPGRNIARQMAATAQC
jgi:acetyltransferase-like isoleucine patch superfamily enzyme